MNRLLIYGVLLLLCLSIPHNCPAQTSLDQSSSCAVLPFYSVRGDFDDADLKFITIEFARALNQSGKCDLISFSRSLDTLENNGWKWSNTRSAVDSALEAGRLLDVSYVFFGRLKKIGTMYSLKTWLLNVPGGRMVNDASTEYFGTKAEFLSAAPPENLSSLLELGKGPSIAGKTQDRYIGENAPPVPFDIEDHWREAENAEMYRQSNLGDSLFGPRSKPVNQQDNFLITPMIGFFYGYDDTVTEFGAEFQYAKLPNFGLKFAGNDNSDLLFYLNLYISPNINSLYYSLRMTIDSDNDDQDVISGFLLGFRWDLGSNIITHVGLGVDGNVEDAIAEINLGYQFSF